MHYKNGREAKIGDTVVVLEGSKPALLGLLIEANGTSTTCNGRVLPKPIHSAAYVTIGDCLHVDDLNSS